MADQLAAIKRNLKTLGYHKTLRTLEDEAAEKAIDRESETSESESEDSPDDQSDSSEDERPSSEPNRKRKRGLTPDSSSDSSSDADSSSEEEGGKATKRVKTVKTEQAVDTREDSSSSDSDSDSSSSDDSASAASSPSSDSSSASSSSRSPSPAPKQKPAKTTKGATSQTHNLQQPKPLAPAAQRTGSTSSSSATLRPDAPTDADLPDQSADKLIIAAELPATKSNVKKLKREQVPFSRIPADQKVAEKFKSNQYVPYEYADSAFRDLSVTKGKGFTKEKNKKKRGSYRGGAIDLTPKGIKFDD